MKTLSLVLCACALSWTLMPSAWAAPASDPQAEPDTVVLSDTLHYDDAARTSTFTGNVILTRGAMTLRADKLVTREDAQGNQYGTATAAKGQVVTVRQENPEKFETLIGTGQQADYDGQTGDVTLSGRAVVTRQVCGQAFDNIQGARIVYHEKTGTYEAFGGKDSAATDGRVRSLAQPQSRVDAAIARCRAKRP